MLCHHCSQAILQTEFGNWVHEILGVTYCHTQFPETLYNNWDTRTARPAP